MLGGREEIDALGCLVLLGRVPVVLVLVENVVVVVLGLSDRSLVVDSGLIE